MAVLLDRLHDLKDLSHGLTVSSAFSGSHDILMSQPYIFCICILHRVYETPHKLPCSGSKILMDLCSHNLFASKFNNQFDQNIVLPLAFSIDYIKL